MDDYQRSLETFFDEYATQVDSWHRKNAGYHKAIASLARFYIPSGARVLEHGSGNGDLLAALDPFDGWGIDISSAMVRLAAAKYPRLNFRRMAAESLDRQGKQFDYIILLVFERLRAVYHTRTRIILNWYSKLWQPILVLSEKLGLKYPQPLLNWTTPEDIRNLLQLAGFEIVRTERHLLLPKRVPLLNWVANRYLAHCPGLNWRTQYTPTAEEPVAVAAR